MVRRELLEKRRGTNASLYLAKGGLADEASSDAIPDGAGGEGSHGAAIPDPVIHRCHINSFLWTKQQWMIAMSVPVILHATIISTRLRTTSSMGAINIQTLTLLETKFDSLLYLRVMKMSR